jgi:hypothetical protein
MATVIQKSRWFSKEAFIMWAKQDKNLDQDAATKFWDEMKESSSYETRFVSRGNAGSQLEIKIITELRASQDVVQESAGVVVLEQ